MARALVTGATGFIGRRLVETLVRAGDRVTCLVRRESAREELEHLGVDFAIGNITDPDSLARPVAEAEVVYHLAAILKVPWRADFREDNVAGARNLARACAAAPHPPTVVVASSLAAGGPAPVAGTPRREEDPAAPVSRYGRVKLACEEELLAVSDRVPIRILRPPMVFGPGDRSALALFRMASRGWCVVPSLRDRRLSQISVDDLAEVLRAAGERGERAGETGAPGAGIYYVAGGEQPTFAELCRHVADAIGRSKVRMIRVPAPVTWTVAAVSETIARLRNRPTFLNLDKAREANAGDWTCSTLKANRDLGLRTRPLAERLGEAAAWYREHGWLAR